MKPKKQDNSWQIIVLIICLCYISGIIGGFLLTELYNLSHLSQTAEISENPLFNSLFFFMRLTLPLWMAGFLSAGLFFTVPWFIVCGGFYGICANVVMSYGTPMDFFMNFLQFLLFTAVVFILGASSMNLSLSQYKQYKNPKTKLPRERRQKVNEHLILLLLSTVLLLLSALIRVYSIIS